MPTRATPHARSEQETRWIFRWRWPSAAPFPALIPCALAALPFALLLGLVRVKVAAPQFEMASKASWIQLTDTADGRLWAMRAKEGGPLLSRYEPSTCQAYATLEEAPMQATRIAPQTYLPKLRELPQQGPLEPLALAAKGETVFPRRTRELAAPSAMPASRLVPVLYPLSALGECGLPQSLPPLVGDLDAATAAAEWRFLLRLHPAGGVAECVSLTEAAGAGAKLLENWLHGVTFDPRLALDGGWLAVGIQFNNQASRGTEPR